VKTSPFDHFVPPATVRVGSLIGDFDDALARSLKNEKGDAALRCLENISGNYQLNGFNQRSPDYHYEI
jgi:hypothetical protein